MLSWLLLALAATIIVAVALQHWKQSRKLRRARKPTAPRLPVVLAHGFLGFDEIGLGNRKHLYFRGIGKQLERAGAQLYCPRVPPASSVSARAARLADLIRALPEPRVNIVAHSMGGLDARFAISRLGLADKVASSSPSARHISAPRSRTRGMPCSGASRGCCASSSTSP